MALPTRRFYLKLVKQQIRTLHFFIYFLLCKIKVAQGRGLEGHISLGLWDYNQNTQSWQVAHILDFMKKNCMHTCQVVFEKHWWFVHHKHSSYQSSSEKLNLDRCACKMHAGCMHSCQNEVGQNFIWLILPSGSDTFAHFCIFFHLLHFTTLHSLCHKWLMLLSSSKIIVPSNGQVQKPSLSCKKPACWFIKIWSNRESKTMQDFLWKGGRTFQIKSPLTQFCPKLIKVPWFLLLLCSLK